MASKNNNKTKISISKFECHLAQSKSYFYFEDNWLKNSFNTREKYFYHRLFQIYIPGEDNPNKLVFCDPIGSAKKPICLISILMLLQSNMFNMTEILLYSVA